MRKHKSAIILLLVLLCAISNLFAWQRIWGGDEDDTGSSVLECSTGGYLIGGSTESFATMSYHDGYLIRIDESGDTLWTKTHGGLFRSWIGDIIKCSSGDYLAVANDADFNLVLLRLDENGDTIWAQTHVKPLLTNTWDTFECSAGGFFSLGWADECPYLLRTDSLGNEIWRRVYYDYTSAWLFGAIEVLTGGFMGVGRIDYYDSTYTLHECFTLCVDSIGDTLWSNRYRIDRYSSLEDIIRCSSGGYMAIGYSMDSLGNSNYLLLRLDEEGDTVWSRLYGPPPSSENHGRHIIECSSGGYLLMGYTWWYFSSAKDIYLFRIDETGDTLWTGVYGRELHDAGNDIIEYLDGGFLIVGSSQRMSGVWDIIAIRIDSAGNLMSINSEVPVPEKFEISAYPNPFNSAVTINIDCRSESAEPLSTIGIFDINGRMVEEIPLNPPLTRGTSDSPLVKGGQGGIISWRPAPALGSGVYFVRATIGGQSTAKRVVYLK